jgi:hypothetical protein
MEVVEIVEVVEVLGPRKQSNFDAFSFAPSVGRKYKLLWQKSSHFPH